MGQCYGKVFLDSRTVLDNIRGNFSTPLSLPMELFQQFNYCGSLNTDESDDAFSVLAESVCMAKVSANSAQFNAVLFSTARPLPYR